MSKIEIKKIGITNVGTECIVNAANDGLWEGGGVCGIIFKAAGSAQLTKACQKIGHCPTGSAVITPAFNLSAKHIIHAVGPIWHGGTNKEPQQLYGCYKKSLELAKEYNCHSIGFPLISAGIFGYPKDRAWRKAIQACNDFIKQNPDYEIDIKFAIIDDEILKLGQDTLKEIVTSNKVEESTKNNELSNANISDPNLVNINKLNDAIDFFCENRIMNKTRLNGSSNLMQVMEPDYDYLNNYKKYCEGVLPTNMNISQIRTMITWLLRADHFGYDYLSTSIKDGTVLKLLLRLDDLIKNNN